MWFLSKFYQIIREIDFPFKSSVFRFKDPQKKKLEKYVWKKPKTYFQ